MGFHQAADGSTLKVGVRPSAVVDALARPLNGLTLFVGGNLDPWPIPQGFEQLVRDHIRRTRSEDRDYLSAYDFPQGHSVRLGFPDGSFAYFESAFFIEDPTRQLTAVFTEHCGYHVFSTIGLTIVTLRATRHGGAAGEYRSAALDDTRLSGGSLLNVFTFHFAKTGIGTTLNALWQPPTGREVVGLHHAECMTRMTLGAPILSPARMQLRHLTMFAAWESHAAIDDFLAGTRLGRALATGWHVRMAFQRRWGYVSEFDGLAESVGEQDPAAPVVAVTLARMKLPQVPRFVHWGRPVEELVRDHPGTTLAIAAMRLPRTVSTFSVWKSQREMLDMVRGHSSVVRPDRHASAMAERQRKDFHFEFTTLRFRPIAEYGSWEGRAPILPS